MLSTNPYDAVNIDAIPIEEIGVISEKLIFKVHTSLVKPFEACVLRQHLVDFLFDHMQDEWYLGNDGQYIRLSPDDIVLALSVRDAKKFVAYGWTI